jgi:cytochrome P450
MGDAQASTDTAPFDPAFWTDPYRFYPLLLAGPPLRLPLLIPAVVVARYDDAVEVLGDAQRFSSRVPVLPFIPKLDPFVGTDTALFSDPPTHTRLRRVLSRHLRGRTIEALSGRIRATVAELVGRIGARGAFDAVADLGVPLPTTIVAHVLGVRLEDEPMLRSWADEINASVRNSLAIAGALAVNGATNGGADGTRACAVADAIPTANADVAEALREYFLREIARREADPGDDLVSASIPALRAGELSRDELVAMAMLVLFAGGDTTTNLINNGLFALATHPEAYDRLRREPDLIGSAVEEILRYDSPVQSVMRYPKHDTTVGGTDVPGGGAVVVLLGAANRDPGTFEDPDRFDVTRRPNRHLAFGDGIHSCVGAQLARLQGQIALGAVVERFPQLRLRDPETPPQYGGSLMSRALISLPLIAGC